MTKPVTVHTARAVVTTELAPRYAKQLASHFGHKAEVRIEAEGPRIILTGGSCLLLAGDRSLELRAFAETDVALDRLTRVIGSHLERFGQRDGLTVLWADRA